MPSHTALEKAIRAGQAAMETLIAQQKQAAIEKRDELVAASRRQQERLVRSMTTANLTDTPVGAVHSRFIGTLSRAMSTKRERLNAGFRNILEVEQVLEGLRHDISDARAKLLYKLLSFWEKDASPETAAAVEGLRGVLRSTDG